jgi:hypothetical protein
MVLTEYPELYGSCCRVANTIHSYALVCSGQMPGMRLKPQNRPVVQKLYFFSLQIQQVSVAVSPVFSCFTYKITAFYGFYQKQICPTESSDITVLLHIKEAFCLFFAVMKHSLLVQENNINFM